ncbi:serine/threonine protein kinase [Scytonema sp. HK-05]|uniref:serine/threonine-protein kinase n=1 Tax=Scytonema sp. HK-05 TaxID=1137095 RepID=UPI000937996A|nr:serine/threonine-protein kinase [Scytonema sp. HK-05]OKH54906.1 serine/threonine protein kinase [Scytonema sp. HK-05]BAY48855.1 serine/threonine protein kinase [Scytonema sp. HK-05]
MTTLLNNRYQVIEVLGGGGFSETFLAEDTYVPSRRRCVIKQLKPITHDAQIYGKIQRRFEREAATLEYLGEGSDQIPKLFAYFTENGQFYLIQEWIEGSTLSNVVKAKGPVRETVVREILLSLLSVLDYIHSKGIIHRDIKPDNIILRSSNSKPVLIDFGAVKAMIHSVVSPGNLTQSLVVGTPGYMPSEQAIGRPVYATDIYSLGLTAIYLLTGKRPQEFRTNPETGEIVWQDYASGVSASLAKVLNRAIKPQASDRYTTASKMLRALQSAIARPLWLQKALQRRLLPQRTALQQFHNNGYNGNKPPQTADSPTPTVAKPTVAQSPTNASLQQTQVLSSSQNTLLTLVYSTRKNWQKPTWIVSSLVVGGLMSVLAIAFITRKPASEVPIATSPASAPASDHTTNPTLSPQSPASTSKKRNTPVASQPTSPAPVVPVTSVPPEKDNQNSPVFTPKTRTAPRKNSLGTSSNIARVPGFPTGTSRSSVEEVFGKPVRDSRGFWRNTRAVTYVLVPNQIELGYLFDADSGVIRQTEVAFAQSVDFQVMLTTLEGMLGNKATQEINQGLQQVQQRQLNSFRFSIGSLKGQIVRQDCDLIYISVWDANLHDFVSPSDARKC